MAFDETLTDGTFTLTRVEIDRFVFTRNDGSTLDDVEPSTPLSFYQSFMIKKILSSNANVSNCTLTHRVHIEAAADGLSIELIIRSVDEKDETKTVESKNTDSQNIKESQTQTQKNNFFDNFTKIIKRIFA